jgi:hypothetical protein
MCEDKKRLLNAYERLELAWGRSLAELVERSGSLSQIDRAAMRDSVEAAGLETERARIELETHVNQHKC